MTTMELTPSFDLKTIKKSAGMRALRYWLAVFIAFIAIVVFFIFFSKALFAISFGLTVWFRLLFEICMPVILFVLPPIFYFVGYNSKRLQCQAIVERIASRTQMKKVYKQSIETLREEEKRINEHRIAELTLLHNDSVASSNQSLHEFIVVAEEKIQAMTELYQRFVSMKIEQVDLVTFLLMKEKLEGVVRLFKENVQSAKDFHLDMHADLQVLLEKIHTENHNLFDAHILELEQKIEEEQEDIEVLHTLLTQCL